LARTLTLLLAGVLTLSWLARSLPVGLPVLLSGVRLPGLLRVGRTLRLAAVRGLALAGCVAATLLPTLRRARRLSRMLRPPRLLPLLIAALLLLAVVLLPRLLPGLLIQLLLRPRLLLRTGLLPILLLPGLLTRLLWAGAVLRGVLLAGLLLSPGLLLRGLRCRVLRSAGLLAGRAGLGRLAGVRRTGGSGRVRRRGRRRRGRTGLPEQRITRPTCVRAGRTRVCCAAVGSRRGCGVLPGVGCGRSLRGACEWIVRRRHLVRRVRVRLAALARRLVRRRTVPGRWPLGRLRGLVFVLSQR